jgi:predicted dehydrogenase
MVKIGIVGLGFMAATHIKAWRQIPEAELIAVCNPSGRHLDGDLSKVAGNVGDNAPVKLDMSRIKAYWHFHEMLADPDIDLIDICTPTAAHPSQAVAALQAGKHVVCEKPLARNPKLAREIVDAAKTAKGFFMPAMCVRFLPEWVWVQEAIADGRFGKVLGARFRRVAEPPGWGQHNFFDGERSGGALLDLHIHDTDFVQFCFGRPTAVLASGYVKFSGAVDHVSTQYRVASGAMVHAEGSWAMTPGFGFNMAYTVNFERATVDYDLARSPADRLKVFEKDQMARSVTCEGPDGYVRELQHMIAAINTGRPPSIVTAEDALSAVEICEAEEKSVKSGQWVTL